MEEKILLPDMNSIERTKINVLLSARTCHYFPTITPNDVFSKNKENLQNLRNNYREQFETIELYSKKLFRSIVNSLRFCYSTKIDD